MEEIEILVEVYDDFQIAFEKISSMTAFDKNSKVHDVYYFNINDKLLSPDSNNKIYNSLRVRKKDSLSFIAFKKDYYQNDKWLYSDEHETKVDDFATANIIFKELGYEILIEIINNKHTFYHKDFEIVLEEVLNLGLFLEIEYIGKETGNVESIKEDIRGFMKKLNISISAELNSGKPELMLRKVNHKLKV